MYAQIPDFNMNVLFIISVSLAVLSGILLMTAGKEMVDWGTLYPFVIPSRGLESI